MYSIKGMRLPTIQEYAHTLSSMDEADDCKYSPHGAITEPNQNYVFVVEANDGRYRLVPGNEFSPRLYRGQTEFFEVCKPSVFRIQKHIDGLYNKIKVIEFLLIMLKHPAVQGMIGVKFFGHEFDFQIGPIAQHYQFKTTLLDFSRSKDVAMFFATNSYDEKSDTYTPMTSGTGVLYTVDLRQLILSRSNQFPLIPLGLEPLPRPDAQCAFAVIMRETENLNDMRWAKYEKFEITKQVSELLSDLFEGGKKLFPSNPFDDYIREIRLNGTVSMQALEWGLRSRELPPHPRGSDGARQELIEAGYAIDDRAVDVRSDLIESATQDWEIRKMDYLRRMKCRLTCDHHVSR